MTIARAQAPPGYFRLLRIPLLEGRDFTEWDHLDTAPVMIVNGPFAQRFFAGRSPLGHKVRAWGKWFTVVGLTKGAKYYTLTEPPRPFFYVPFRQIPAPEDIAFYVRTAGDPTDALATLRREAAAVDPDAGAFDAMPLSEYIGAPLFPQRFAASLLSALGAMSLLLAAVGLYSVMAYVVSQRTHEIGIRLALGAQPRDMLGMIVRKGIVLTGAGVLAGLAAALAIARLISGMLVSMSAFDPLIFASAALFLVLVALLAN